MTSALDAISLPAQAADMAFGVTAELGGDSCFQLPSPAATPQRQAGIPGFSGSSLPLQLRPQQTPSPSQQRTPARRVLQGLLGVASPAGCGSSNAPSPDAAINPEALDALGGDVVARLVRECQLDCQPQVGSSALQQALLVFWESCCSAV